MDFRTKLILSTVATSLASMALLAVLFIGAFSDMVRAESLSRLATLARTRAADFAVVGDAWLEEARLVQTRTRMRDRLARFGEDPEGSRAEIRRVLEDAVAGTEQIRALHVHAPDGALIATTADGTDPARRRLRAPSGLTAPTEFFEDEQGRLAVALHLPLSLNGAEIGRLTVELDAEPLRNLLRDDADGGESGEVYVIGRFETGAAILNPLRHAPGEGLRVVPAEARTRAMRAALAGASAVITDAGDYRSEPVWAAVHPLPRIGGGIVVKVDAAEARAPLEALQQALIEALVALGAFGILAGAAVGAWLARPIRALHDVVERIRAGDVSARASEDGEDEVSFLAESFNALMDERARPQRDD